MAVMKIFDQNKNEIGEMNLVPEIFEVQVKPEILHMAVRSHLASERSGTVGVKGWADVRGGGRKPYRQKGTGRARAGSTRSPIWRGGAVVFGPVARDYSFKINKKVRKLAMRMALSSKLASNSLTLVDKLEMSEIKTRNFFKVTSDFGLKKALIVIPKEDNNISLSARNIPGIRVVEQSRLNVYEIMCSPQLVLTREAVEMIQERFK